MNLAKQLDPSRYERLARTFHPDDPSVGLTAEDITAAALELETHFAGLVPKAVQAEMKKKRNAAYVRNIVTCYSHYFALGIANLVNTLNLDHVAVGGGVVRRLSRLEFFEQQVRRHLRDYALGAPYVTLKGPLTFEQYNFETPQAERQSAKELWGWRGAALLFVDPSYDAAVGAGA